MVRKFPGIDVKAMGCESDRKLGNWWKKTQQEKEAFRWH